MSLIFLRTSHVVYIAYLVFQLWSHTHLYEDPAKRNPSKRMTCLAVNEKAANQPNQLSTCTFDRTVVEPESPTKALRKSDVGVSVVQVSPGCPEQATSGRDVDVDYFSLGNISVDVTQPTVRGVGRTSPTDCGIVENKSVPFSQRRPFDLAELKDSRKPRLSWGLTFLLLFTVTVVRLWISF
jgi:hypothetical protein